MEFHHVSILLGACVDALAIRKDGTYLDATLGGAGHSLAIAQRLGEGGRLIGIDRDDAALGAARERLKPVWERVTLVKSDFRALKDAAVSAGVTALDGALFDLGVSSPQLDDAARGFSYMQDAPLDMRMDRTAPLSARDVVNGYEKDALVKILFEYGEERYAHRIAAAIVRARERRAVETTFELVDIVRSAMPPQALREKQHPAKRTFQAIRIAVNDELTAVAEGVRQAIELLAPGGRIAVISFHSLEDRIVKNTYQSFTKGCTCPPEFPVCVCGRRPSLKLVSRKPILPDEEEIAANPRARSAKLRVAEKL